MKTKTIVSKEFTRTIYGSRGSISGGFTWAAMGVYQEMPDFTRVYIVGVAIEYVDVTLNGFSRSQISEVPSLKLQINDGTSDNYRSIIANGVAQGTIYSTSGGVKIRITWPYDKVIGKYVSPSAEDIRIDGNYNLDLSSGILVAIKINQLKFANI